MLQLDFLARNKVRAIQVSYVVIFNVATSYPEFSFIEISIHLQKFYNDGSSDDKRTTCNSSIPSRSSDKSTQ